PAIRCSGDDAGKEGRTRGEAAANRAMRDRYCATEDCEPCQAGNRAALSRNHRVPQSCRFRAQTAERQPGVRFRIDRVRSCGALNGNSIETTLSIEAMYRACSSDTSKRDKSS